VSLCGVGLVGWRGDHALDFGGAKQTGDASRQKERRVSAATESLIRGRPIVSD
jgi:hypothetical protein